MLMAEYQQRRAHCNTPDWGELNKMVKEAANAVQREMEIVGGPKKEWISEETWGKIIERGPLVARRLEAEKEAKAHMRSMGWMGTPQEALALLPEQMATSLRRALEEEGICHKEVRRLLRKDRKDQWDKAAVEASAAADRGGQKEAFAKVRFLAGI